MNDDRLKDLVTGVLAQAERGLKASEVHTLLTESYDTDVAERTVQEALRQMADAEEIPRERISDGSPGAPPYHYFHPSGLGDEAGGVSGDVPEESAIAEGDLEATALSTRGEQLPPDEEGEDSHDLLQDIAQHHLKQSDYVRLVKQISPDIAEEDPRELLLEMLTWTLETIDTRGREIYDLYRKGDLRAFYRKKEELEGLARFADRFFQRVYRLDASESAPEGMLMIPDVREYYGEDLDENELPAPWETWYDEDAIRERLSERVFGESIVMAYPIDYDVEDAVGTDASVADLTLRNQERLVRRTEFQLFTGAAALQREDSRFTDFDFEPDTFRRYRHRQAFKQGLVVSGRVHPELSDGQVTHARYAAMDLRQYNENIRVAQGEADWRPVGDVEDEPGDASPDVVFGDGRVFPLVHQISDFESRNIYGELVRNEIKRFDDEMLLERDAFSYNTVFAGVVKRSALTWLSPLVFWYINVKKAGELDDVEEPDPGEIPLDIYEPRLSDALVSNILFVGLADSDTVELNEDDVFATFRVLRRFYDMSLDDPDIPPRDEDGNIMDEDSFEEWRGFFERRIADRDERGYETLELEDYKHYAALCAASGTVMSYGAPHSLYMLADDSDLDADLDRYVLLPRLEVATSPPADVEDEMLAALSWFARYPRLDMAHLSEDHSRTDGIPILVPAVIEEADRAAKFARDMMGSEIEQELYHIISELQG